MSNELTESDISRLGTALFPKQTWLLADGSRLLSGITAAGLEWSDSTDFEPTDALCFGSYIECLTAKRVVFWLTKQQLNVKVHFSYPAPELLGSN